MPGLLFGLVLFPFIFLACALVSVPQWVVLRHYMQRAILWILVTGLAAATAFLLLPLSGSIAHLVGFQITGSTDQSFTLLGYVATGLLIAFPQALLLASSPLVRQWQIVVATWIASSLLGFAAYWGTQSGLGFLVRAYSPGLGMDTWYHVTASTVGGAAYGSVTGAALVLLLVRPVVNRS